MLQRSAGNAFYGLRFDTSFGKVPPRLTNLGRVGIFPAATAATLRRK